MPVAFYLELWKPGCSLVFLRNSARGSGATSSQNQSCGCLPCKTVPVSSGLFLLMGYPSRTAPVASARGVGKWQSVIRSSCTTLIFPRVYLLEGLVTILFAGVVYAYLPDYPKSTTSARFLTEREQEYLELRLPDNAPKTHEPSFNTQEIFTTLKDVRLWSFCLAQVCINIGGYALQWQLPTVTTSLGYAGLPRNQLLNIAPAAATVLFIIFTSWFMSRAYTTRAEYLLVVSAVGFAFFVVLAAPGVPRGGIYVACVFGTTCYAGYFIPFWACKPHSRVPSSGYADNEQGEPQRSKVPQVPPSPCHCRCHLARSAALLVPSYSSRALPTMHTRRLSPFARLSLVLLGSSRS